MDRRIQLPQELIDTIIENLGDANWTLRSCSFVCSSWLLSTRRCLFRCIVLLPLYNSSPRPLLYGRRLHNLLLKSPHIATYIRELKLYEGQSIKGEAWIGSDQSLPLVLGMLKDLTRIELRRLEWNALPPALRQSIQNVLALPSLQFLKMEHSNFASLDDFSRLLSHAKSLTDLSLGDINTHHRFWKLLSLEGSSQGRDAKEQEVYSHRRTHLLDLHLITGDSWFVDWILGSQSPLDVSRVQTLRIDYIDLSEVHTVNRLLHAIGDSLKRFKFNPPAKLWIDPDADPVASINIGRNPNVKSLHILDFHIPSPVTGGSYQDMLRLFSDIGESCRLEELKLDVSISMCNEEPIDGSPWERLDRILAGTNFKFLRKLDIIVFPSGLHSSDWLDGICASVVRWLPLLRAGGVSVECNF